MAASDPDTFESRRFSIRPFSIGLCIVVMAVIGVVVWTASPTHTRPDPRLAESLDRWPNQADIDRLASVKGKSPTETIRILGHPRKVVPGENGTQIWDYPWSAACRVWFKNGVVDDTYYTAGY
ncbi:MAG: hypothetical protein HY290_29770 [Planctomycetia bacterium]|nr:hypothetical protein [Planctomycetia bacterium]